MAQTKPKAAQFYGVSNNGTAGQVLTSDGNGGMSWGANTENFTVSWNTPTGQSLTYTQPSPQSSSGAPSSTFPTTTFTVTKSGIIISGTATIVGLPTGITATQVITGSGAGNTLTVTLSGVFPGADSLNTSLTISGLTLSTPFIVSWATPTGQSLTYTVPSPQTSSGLAGTTFTTTTFTVTKSGSTISGTATIAGLPSGITATQSLNNTNPGNILTVTLNGVYPTADSLNTNLTISGLTVIAPLTVNWLIVAGGGGGAGGWGGIGSGGGGAGGLRTSWPGGSGGGGNSENPLNLSVGTNYNLTIGGPGAGIAAGSGAIGGTGASSTFNGILSNGGGGARSYVDGSASSSSADGGSGGGGTYITISPGSTNGATSQGYAGGSGTAAVTAYGGGGGGGAAGSGGGGSSSNGGAGGTGLQVNIDGNNYYYAGGGGGGVTGSGTAGIGGSSVGGAGGADVANPGGNNASPANRGSGGGGGGYRTSGTVYGGGGNGSGGVVILRYPSSYTIGGLSGSTTTVGSDSVTTFSTGTGNVNWTI